MINYLNSPIPILLSTEYLGNKDLKFQAKQQGKKMLVTNEIMMVALQKPHWKYFCLI